MINSIKQTLMNLSTYNLQLINGCLVNIQSYSLLAKAELRPEVSAVLPSSCSPPAVT